MLLISCLFFPHFFLSFEALSWYRNLDFFICHGYALVTWNITSKFRFNLLHVYDLLYVYVCMWSGFFPQIFQKYFKNISHIKYLFLCLKVLKNSIFSRVRLIDHKTELLKMQTRRTRNELKSDEGTRWIRTGGSLSRILFPHPDNGEYIARSEKLDALDLQRQCKVCSGWSNCCDFWGVDIWKPIYLDPGRTKACPVFRTMLLKWRRYTKFEAWQGDWGTRVLN